MFTGLVQKVAKVGGTRRQGSASVIEVELGELVGQVAIGDSVAVDGVCLTATASSGGRASFDVSAETLRKSALGDLRGGQEVNIELAMRPTDRFGGHFVSGHVDGTGVIAERAAVPGETRMKVSVPAELARMMVMKGSVAVDGVSLTVAALSQDSFEVSLIPHTLEVTTLGKKRPGARVNIECDMIGKWVLRLLASGRNARGGLTLDKLQEDGY